MRNGILKLNLEITVEMDEDVSSDDFNEIMDMVEEKVYNDVRFVSDSFGYHRGDGVRVEVDYDMTELYMMEKETL